MTPVSEPKGIWPVLAGMRFFFAAWVLFDHTYNFGPAERAMPVFTRSGLVAVLCFFVISGFSIHHSATTQPNGYGARRFWRIAPVHVLSLLIVVIGYLGFGLAGGYGTPAAPPSLWKWLGSLLLLQCLLPVKLPFLAPAWSLSIEVLYYMAAPILRGCRGFTVGAIAIASCVLFVVWPFLSAWYMGDATFGLGAAAMVWAWLAGWIAYARRGSHRWVVLLIAGGFAGIGTQGKFFDVTDVTSAAANLLAWATTVLVVFYRAEISSGTGLARVLNYLGEISYPLYLIHYPVLFVLTSSILKSHPEWNSGPVEVAAALACAVLAYHLVDAPLRLRSRPAPRPVSVALAASG